MLITLWGVAGCAAWTFARLEWPPEVPGAPGWAYALAAGSVLGGGIALLRKKGIAKPLFIVALIAAAGQFGWLMMGSDVLAEQMMSRAALAVSVLGLAGLLVWFADYSRRHGWIM
jgi:hypothetical protein